MPDLGKYAAEVILAYCGSGLLIAGIVWASVAEARRARRDLEDSEKRSRRA